MNEMASGVRVRFWEDAYKNEAKSKEAGRAVYDTVDWCEIQVLGESDTSCGPVHRMQPDPRERFAAAWADYQKKKDGHGLIGTPLAQVAWLGRGEVETFRASGIQTLEHLSEVSDANITKFPGGLDLRQKARDQIRLAKESAPLQKLSEELAQRDAKIAELEERLAELARPRRKGKEE